MKQGIRGWKSPVCQSDDQRKENGGNSTERDQKLIRPADVHYEFARQILAIFYSISVLVSQCAEAARPIRGQKTTGSVCTTWGLAISWWRHQMETFSALLAICAGYSPVTGEFPAQRPVTRGFGVLFDLCLNKRLSKQSWGWWFETPSRPLWRHCNIHSARYSHARTWMYDV